MQKRKFVLFYVFFLFLAGLSFPETFLLKNANIYLHNGNYQADSYIIIEGVKIAEVGLMKNLKKMIPDREFDLAGNFVYPAFIDCFYTGFLKKPPAKKMGGSQRPGSTSVDKTKRKPLSERSYFLSGKSVNSLKLEKTKINKLISSGFAYLHVIPQQGIISGTTSVISLVTNQPSEAVLVPEKYMTLQFKTHPGGYPSTSASLLAELFQLKEDSFYYQKMKNLHSYLSTKRLFYKPDLDVLYPYFNNQKQLLITSKNLVHQRMVEILAKKLKIRPVLVASPDVWRRGVNSNLDVILPLKFKPPLSSKYAMMGDKIKKETEKKLYPEKIAGFFKTHKRISLAPPGKGDYKTLFKNIKILMKKGIKEAEIIQSLTVRPAKLLNISRYAGSIEKGKLASFFVADKKIFEEKAKINKAFVEGKYFEFKEKKGKTKPPTKNLTGKWNVKIESRMGTFELKMTIEQEGNDFTAELVSPMGKMEVQNGVVSGDEVTFSTSAPIGGQDTNLEFSGKIKGENIEGTITIGSMGDAEFVATPENSVGGLK